MRGRRGAPAIGRGRRRRGRAIGSALLAVTATVAAVVVAGAPPATAGGVWTDPTVLDTIPPTSFRIATAVDGTVVAVWTVADRTAQVRAAVRMPGEYTWGPTTIVAQGVARSARVVGVVSEGNGAATVAVLSGGLSVYSLRAGTWSAAWNVASADAGSLAVGPTGRVAVAYTSGTGAARTVKVRERPNPGAAWTAALTRGSGANVRMPVVGLGTHPRLVVGWMTTQADGTGQLVVRRRNAAGAWSAQLGAATTGFFAETRRLEAGVAPDGTFSALMAFSGDGDVATVFTLSPANAWSTTAVGDLSQWTAGTSLRVSPLDGSAVWHRFAPGFDTPVVGGVGGRRTSTGGTWGPDLLDQLLMPRWVASVPWRDGYATVALVDTARALSIAVGGPNGSWDWSAPRFDIGETADAVDVGVSAAGVSTVVYVSESAGTVKASQAGMALPLVLAPPTLTGRTAVGSVLTCGPGSWSEARSVTLRWYRSGIQLPTTAATYRVTAADRGSTLRCGVEATNVAGTSFELSRTVTIK
jgi:hypothetical protein